MCFYKGQTGKCNPVPLLLVHRCSFRNWSSTGPGFSSGELAFRNLVAIKLIQSTETRYKVAIWVHIVRLDLSLYRFGGVY